MQNFVIPNHSLFHHFISSWTFVFFATVQSICQEKMKFKEKQSYKDLVDSRARFFKAKDKQTSMALEEFFKHVSHLDFSILGL